MAICKILHINDAGSGASSHLATAIDYVLNGEKTQESILTGGYNLQVERAFAQMMETKEIFGKTGGRQAYHMIISFQEGETDVKTAMEITEQFVKEYLGDQYEAVYAVHDNTKHVHAHIIFNSVSFATGLKYHYKKNDWARFVQPVINRICREHDLSVVEVNPGEKHDRYQEWNEWRDGDFVWSDMIKRDLDIAIAEAKDFDDFLAIMRSRGYEDKQNKYLAFRAPGMSRFRRTERLGKDYSRDRIEERIRLETVIGIHQETMEEAGKIVWQRISGRKRAKLTPIQKKYYARLFRLGLIMRRPYSKAWQYRDEIKRFHELQEQYLFLCEHELNGLEDLKKMRKECVAAKKKKVSEKNRNYRMNKKCESLFQIADRMKEVSFGHQAFLSGDEEFREEYETWKAQNERLLKEGYSFDEVEMLREGYKAGAIRTKKELKELTRNMKIMEGIIAETEREMEREAPQKHTDDKKEDRERKRQGR